MSSDHIYINLNNYNQDVFSKDMEIQNNFSTQVINDPTNWFASITSMSLSGSTIPLIDFSEYTNKLIVNIKYGSSTYQASLIYVPQGNANDQYIYEYSQFVDMTNTALQDACVLLNTASPGTVSHYPFIVYNTNTSKFELWASSEFLDSAGTPVEIWFNTPLYNFYQSFQYIKFDDTLGLRLSIVQKPIFGYTNGNLQSYNNGMGNIDYYVMSQELVTKGSLATISSIFVTSDLPTSSESITVVQSNNYVATSSNNSSEKILANFAIDRQYSPENYLSTLLYVPSAQYRLVDMISNQPVTSINLRFYWQDKNGQAKQLQLEPLSAVNVKLLFVRKSFYDKGNPLISK